MNNRLASDIEEAGYDAGYQGRGADENPYHDDSEESYAWHMAYVNGESDWENSDVGYET